MQSREFFRVLYCTVLYFIRWIYRADVGHLSRPVRRLFADAQSDALIGHADVVRSGARFGNGTRHNNAAGFRR